MSVRRFEAVGGPRDGDIVTMHEGKAWVIWQAHGDGSQTEKGRYELTEYLPERCLYLGEWREA